MPTFITLNILERYDSETDTAYFTKEIELNLDHVVYMEKPYDMNFPADLYLNTTRIVLSNGSSFIVQGHQHHILENWRIYRDEELSLSDPIKVNVVH